MICSFVGILAWKSDDDDDTDADNDDAADADDDYDDDRKSDPYMSPSYAGDTKTTIIKSAHFETGCPLWVKKQYISQKPKISVFFCSLRERF